MYLSSLDMAYHHGQEIVITGDPADETTRALLAQAQQQYLPNAIMIFLPSLAAEAGEDKEYATMERQHETDESQQVFSFLKDKFSLDGNATAYVCEDFACQAPTTDVEHFKAQLVL